MDKVPMNLQLFAGEAAVKAISTYGITLKWGPTSEDVTKKVDIKNFPDLGGAPELIEVTTLSDAMQSFILGIQTSGEMPFTCNYTKDNFETANSDTNTELYYALEFGAGGSEGIFEWQGMHSVHVTGADVNAPVEMVVTIAPSTKPTLKDSGD